MEESLSTAQILGFKQLQVLKAFTKDKRYIGIVNTLDNLYRRIKNEISEEASKIFAVFHFNPKVYADEFLAKRAKELATAKRRKLEDEGLYCLPSYPAGMPLPYTITKPFVQKCSNCEILQAENSKIRLECDQKDREIQDLKNQIERLKKEHNWEKLNCESAERVVKELKGEILGLKGNINSRNSTISILKKELSIQGQKLTNLANS